MADDDDSYRSLGDTVSDTRDQVAKGKSDRSKARGAALASGLGGIADTESTRASQASDSIRPVQYKKGGKVRKTGRAIVHKGERVIPRGKVKKVERLMKRSKMRMKSGRR